MQDNESTFIEKEIFSEAPRADWFITGCSGGNNSQIKSALPPRSLFFDLGDISYTTVHRKNSCCLTPNDTNGIKAYIKDLYHDITENGGRVFICCGNHEIAAFGGICGLEGDGAKGRNKHIYTEAIQNAVQELIVDTDNSFNPDNLIYFNRGGCITLAPHTSQPPGSSADEKVFLHGVNSCFIREDNDTGREIITRHKRAIINDIQHQYERRKETHESITINIFQHHPIMEYSSKRQATIKDAKKYDEHAQGLQSSDFCRYLFNNIIFPAFEEAVGILSKAATDTIPTAITINLYAAHTHFLFINQLEINHNINQNNMRFTINNIVVGNGGSPDNLNDIGPLPPGRLFKFENRTGMLIKRNSLPQVFTLQYSSVLTATQDINLLDESPSIQTLNGFIEQQLKRKIINNSQLECLYHMAQLSRMHADNQTPQQALICICILITCLDLPSHNQSLHHDWKFIESLYEMCVTTHINESHSSLITFLKAIERQYLELYFSAEQPHQDPYNACYFITHAVGRLSILTLFINNPSLQPPPKTTKKQENCFFCPDFEEDISEKNLETTPLQQRHLRLCTYKLLAHNITQDQIVEHMEAGISEIKATHTPRFYSFLCTLPFIYCRSLKERRPSNERQLTDLQESQPYILSTDNHELLHFEITKIIIQAQPDSHSAAALLHVFNHIHTELEHDYRTDISEQQKQDCSEAINHWQKVLPIVIYATNHTHSYEKDKKKKVHTLMNELFTHLHSQTQQQP